MTLSPPPRVTDNPAAWSFVSGKIAALEAELQPRSFFEAVLGSATRAEARQALGKSPYRVLFPDDKTLDNVGAVVDARAREVKAELFKLCPPHPLENYFGIGDRFRTFRTLFNQASRQHNAPTAELEALFPLFAVEPAYAEDLREHRDALARKTSPQAAAPVERSLYLDSAACSLMRIVAGYAPEKLVRDYMSDRALLTAWSGIFRARWNGVPADTIKTWFVYEPSPDLAAAVLAAEHEPKAEIGARLTTRSSAMLENVDNARIRADIDSASADVLRDTVLACRMTPFGAERALSYLVAIEMELVNLDLSLSAVANGVDRKVTASRLRREYA